MTGTGREARGGRDLDDRLAQVEQKVAEARQEVADLRRLLAHSIDQSFKWSVITMGVGVIIAWFGIFWMLSRGTSLLRRFMLS